MSKTMMKCGHTANAVHGDDRKPSCAICAGLTPDALVVDDSPPDLSGRTARCGYYGSVPPARSHSSNYGCKRGEKCMCEQPSDHPSEHGLPFFEHRPDAAHDRFYCGCWGWD